MLESARITYNNLSRNKGIVKGNARFGMTMESAAYSYLLDLYNNTFSSFSKTGLP